MTNILLINGHQPFPTSPGKLNAALTAFAADFFAARDCPVRCVETKSAWDLETEIGNQLWAGLIIVQFPLNSMGLPWSLKRYFDEVYTAGMDGRLAKGDGRSRSDPGRQYGSGGRMQDTRYMLSVTSNAPQTAFGDARQTLFSGRSIDDLLSPVHINFAFFGASACPTFAAYDVSKGGRTAEDFRRYEDHLIAVYEQLAA